MTSCQSAVSCREVPNVICRRRQSNTSMTTEEQLRADIDETQRLRERDVSYNMNINKHRDVCTVEGHLANRFINLLRDPCIIYALDFQTKSCNYRSGRVPRRAIWVF